MFFISIVSDLKRCLILYSHIGNKFGEGDESDWNYKVGTKDEINQMNNGYHKNERGQGRE